MLVWTDALTGIEPCVLCGATGFVCARHPSEAAGHDQCDAAGSPCPLYGWKVHAPLRVPRSARTPALVQCSVCEEYQPLETISWFTQPTSKGAQSYATTKDDPLGVAFCARCAARRELEGKEFRSRWTMFED